MFFVLLKSNLLSPYPSVKNIFHCCHFCKIECIYKFKRTNIVYNFQLLNTLPSSITTSYKCITCNFYWRLMSAT